MPSIFCYINYFVVSKSNRVSVCHMLLSAKMFHIWYSSSIDSQIANSSKIPPKIRPQLNVVVKQDYVAETREARKSLAMKTIKFVNHKKWWPVIVAMVWPYFSAFGIQQSVNLAMTRNFVVSGILWYMFDFWCTLSLNHFVQFHVEYELLFFIWSCWFYFYIVSLSLSLSIKA